MSEQNLSKFRRSNRVRLLIGLVTIILIVIMFPKGESIESEVTEGSIWIKDDLIAQLSFPVKKDPEIYKAELEAAARSVYPVFLREDDSVNNILDTLQNYNQFLFRNIDSSFTDPSIESLNPTFLSSESFMVFKNLRSQERNMVPGRNITFRRLFNLVNSTVASIYETGILNVQTGDVKKDSIAVRRGNVDNIVELSRFLTLEQAKNKAKEKLYALDYPSEVENALAEYTVHFIYPNIIYSEKLTNEEIEQAQNNVTKYSGIVNENERIIAKHDRITREAKLKIDSYREAKGEKIGEEGVILQLLGKFLHISFLITLLVIYLYLFRKRIFFDNQKIILIAIIFLFLSFVTYLVNQITAPAPMHYLIIIPAASMLITIIFDSRVGFYTTVILVLITGALRGNDYTFTAMNLFAGALSVYTVRDIKNRSQIFRSFLFILIGYEIAVLAFAFERFASIQSVLLEIVFAASNALISPVLTYGLLIFFEKFFNITTDLTLLELSNFDRPLLKELARKAPGTFNHSMTMGTIAESAAEKVGANPLLARVGAYYHDIGKTIMPQNFVENQLNNQNVHENLSPEESVDLIIKHVNEGIHLAKNENLPQEIIDFIPMHHGTMTMTYFYEKAKKRYGEEKVNIEDYKYPGPKPNTKETAIIMLADGCESAVRSIQDPAPEKVENIIDNIIKNRIETGQLDDSPLTFKDINKIKESFISILLGQHHRRIRYPKQEEMEKKVEEEKEKK